MSERNELDMLIGREVFGIKKFYYENIDFVLGEEGDKEHPFYIPSGKPLRTHRIDAVPLPRYSTLHGWLVVEKMVSEGFAFNIEVTKDEGTQAWFTKKHQYPIAKHDKPAVAICLAALVALGKLEQFTTFPLPPNQSCKRVVDWRRYG